MSFAEALFMGLIQGLTEFLPVSSSGHLAILENLFIKKNSGGILFSVILHVGTLVALLTAFRKDIKRLVLEGCKSIYEGYENIKTCFYNRNHEDARRYKKIISNNYRKLLLLILLTTIPTAVEGFLFENLAEQAGKNLLAPAMGLFITGVLLLIADFFPAGKKIPKDVSYWTAFFVGIFQGMSVFPGVSRAGVTIVVCLLFGFNRKFAVKYSFLVAIPTMLGAVILEMTQLPGSGVTPGVFGTYVAAAMVAGIVGYFCIKGMLAAMRKKKFRFFSIYCFLLGTVAVVCNFAL